VSVINNIWRLLMWRRMSNDWSSGPRMYGAGVGKPWAYNDVFFHTLFHYETDRSGLNPHNSYLNILYRFGAIGLGLLLAVMLSVLFYAWRALRLRLFVGDVLLEGLLLAFFYTAIFSFFTVSLEGPSYALPFWISLGLVYARARQILSLHGEGLQYL
jgi:O-antigen ligase